MLVVVCKTPLGTHYGRGGTKMEKGCFSGWWGILRMLPLEMLKALLCFLKIPGGGKV